MAESYFTVEHLTTKELTQIFSKIKISAERFYQGTPCWEWTGYCDRANYGHFSWRRKLQRPHRVLYAWLVSPLPPYKDGYEIDHLCRNPPCCNPCHLELVTRQEHIPRGYGMSAINAKKTHCAAGHPFTPDNIIPRKHGGRTCKTCHQGWRRLRYLKDRKNPEWVAKTQAAGREYHRRKRKAPQDS